MEKVILNFTEIDPKTDISAEYSVGCSNDGRSSCCTRVCTRNDSNDLQMNKLEAWEKFFEVEAGIIQY